MSVAALIVMVHEQVNDHVLRQVADGQEKSNRKKRI